MKMQNMPDFNVDDFDLIAHKKAATTNAQAKAREKRDRRKISVGKIVVMIAAFIVCALIWIMMTQLTGLF